MKRLGVKVSRLAICSALAAGLVMPIAAHAQQEAQETAVAEPRTGIQEIVVTAQKRAENLQNVPISVTAVTGDALAATQATSLQALQGSIPNVQIDNFANTPQSAVFTIRGIGVIEPDPYAGNTVSIVVDGVPQFFSMGALLDLYDVDRIEVLRGPQGTLFGANTTGGVINVVTAQPTGEFGGHIKAAYGNWNRFDVSGAIEIPLVEDTLSFKVAGIHTERDGWVTNVVDGSDMGSKNLNAVRAYLKFTRAAASMRRSRANTCVRAMDRRSSSTAALRARSSIPSPAPRGCMSVPVLAVASALRPTSITAPTTRSPTSPTWTPSRASSR